MSTGVTLLIDTERLPVALVGYINAFMLNPATPVFGSFSSTCLVTRALAVCASSGMCLVQCMSNNAIAVVRLSERTLELLVSDCWKFIARPIKHLLHRTREGWTLSMSMCDLSKKPVSLESGCHPGTRLALIGWTSSFAVFKALPKAIKLTPLLIGCIAAACSRQVGEQLLQIRMDTAFRYSYKRLRQNRSTRVLKIDEIIAGTHTPTPEITAHSQTDMMMRTSSLSHTLAARSDNLFV